VSATRSTWLWGSLFLGTFAVLVGLIAFVLLTGSMRSMMALAAVAYALASLGFLGVIAWAYLRGQFTDYEDIKDRIFELEERR
jgi:hypothetical protein